MVQDWEDFEDKAFFLDGNGTRYLTAILDALNKGTPVQVQTLSGGLFGLARVKPEGTLMLYYMADDK